MLKSVPEFNYTETSYFTDLRNEKKNRYFVCRLVFKLGISLLHSVIVLGSELAPTEKNCTMFCNNTAVAHAGRD